MTSRSDTPDFRNAGIYRSPAKHQPDKRLNIKELRNRCMGNIQLVERVLKKFQQQIPEQLAELERAQELNDTELISRILHCVKGTAASVSANSLVSAVTEIEDLICAGHMAGVPVRIEQLRNEWESCNRVVRDIMADGTQKEY
ncbi:MAG: Hpt domain-containing protein [Planctomycetia bacterium]|jgi:HPt (histidine-containing phosphotransfer) domain-containing protein